VPKQDRQLPLKEARKTGHWPLSSAEEQMPEKKQFPQSQLEQSAEESRSSRVRFGHAMVFSYAAGSHF